MFPLVQFPFKRGFDCTATPSLPLKTPPIPLVLGPVVDAAGGEVHDGEGGEDGGESAAGQQPGHEQVVQWNLEMPYCVLHNEYQYNDFQVLL